MILLKFHVPSRDFFSFKVLQNFIVYESAEDRNLPAFFNRVKNSLSCIIIYSKYFPNSDWLRAHA